MNQIALQEPENIEVLSKLGDVFSKQNKKKEAADVFIRISELYKKEKMDDKSNDYYKMAQDMDPANPKILNGPKSGPSNRNRTPPPPPPAPPPRASAGSAEAGTRYAATAAGNARHAGH